MEKDAVFFNRDISWLDFNRRVLEEGLRQDLPPLERFRFLSIISSNFDEFFMVRVAAVKRARLVEAGQDPAGIRPEAQLALIAEKTREILRLQYECLRNEIFPALARGGLELVRPDAYTLDQMDYLESLFMREIFPVLTPIRFRAEDGVSAIDSLSLYAAFFLEPASDDPDKVPETTSDPDAAPGEEPQDLIAIIQIPSILERIIRLPPKTGGEGTVNSPRTAQGNFSWALLDDLILTWGAYLFPGYKVRESMLFKINRDADFSVDEKRDEDFIEAMEEVLLRRDYSLPVRMVCSTESPWLRDELARRLELEGQDIYELDGPLDLGSLSELMAVRGFEELRLKNRPIYPSLVFSDDGSLWDRISQGDVMLHMPYQAFDPVLRFFQDAAVDPQVISIKTALYRTSGDSPIVRALEEAALNGKHVTALVELKARFNEKLNISWANRLERAGVIVVYGLARLKVHAKISMVVRREQDGVKRYVHLSTGNYNDKTAKFYEDICLFTAREDIAFDAGLLFNMITGYSVIHSMRKLVIAPTALKERLIELIDREAKRSSRENPGRIMAKMNALADPDVIRALYRASQAGVNIQLNVRGICMLVPGLPGLSENIQVLGLVDRYLEHSRIFYFANAGTEEFYLSSADWMPRNLERRVELMFPVLQEDLRERLRNILEAYFLDNCQSWALGSDGRWIRREPPSSGGDGPFRVQDYLLSQTARDMEDPWAPKQEFVVRRSPPGEG